MKNKAELFLYMKDISPKQAICWNNSFDKVVSMRLSDLLLEFEREMKRQEDDKKSAK